MANLVFKFSWDHRPFPYNSAQGKRQFMLPFASGIPNLTPNFSQVQGTAVVSQGGTGATTALDARANLGAAASGVNSDISELKGLTTPLSISQGGLGADNAQTARMNLGLGTAAILTSTTSQYDPTPGRALRVGDWGMGTEGSRASDMVAPLNNGFFRTDDTLTNDTGNSIGPYGFFLHCTRRSMGVYTDGSHSFQLGKAASYSVLKYRFNNSGTWSNWFNLLTAQNTTTDGNGFIKAASPIVKLFNDHIELNDEAERQPITFDKLGTGDYLVKGSLGFAQEGWYIEVPKDANGNTVVAVEYSTLENGDLSIKTYKRKFDVEKAAIVADHENPMDIPEGRWIDIRLHEEPEPEPEVEETLSETPVDFQPTNLSQAVAAAMNGVEPPEISDTDETF
ncbi:phage tail fiber protein [Acinetobacter baumannii]|uniref:phage tail fiber protein n=1 Tax=Acinetobacter baumannii TaxID=470 RepID=UPI000E58765A|nr:phage tail protein [Acinetobacter baumannii]AXX47950.1 phage tail protein [Acinetobacter baumannii]AXX48326.1 phage tail protein [Acinetobacter baumannii]EKU1715594.1 phage tail protein [Acinetobacter baumannii]EKW2505633.1 phage tail protein [Acinetobacter baumannii]EKW9072801.1 phage tail protein [Acinetobacter baumannii]